MTEERRRILNLLAEKKITAEEAESLLDALGATPSVKSPSEAVAPPTEPKYLRVLVEDHNDEHGGTVNVRVPFNLIRAGVRLAALLPQTAHGPINKALKQNGIALDITQLKPENLEGLVEHLRDFKVDVDGNRGEKVRVFCE